MASILRGFLEVGDRDADEGTPTEEYEDEQRLDDCTAEEFAGGHEAHIWPSILCKVGKPPDRVFVDRDVLEALQARHRREWAGDR